MCRLTIGEIIIIKPIGFDRHAYSNNGPKEHNIRIEMGKRI